MQIIFGPSSHYDSAVVNRHSVITIDLLHITYYISTRDIRIDNMIK